MLYSRILLSLSLLLALSSTAFSENLPDTDINKEFKSIKLSDYIDTNQVSAEMAAAKNRFMLQPKAIQFDALLLQPPKPGKFSLVYDALSLWQSNSPLPTVDHSAFLQTDDERVIAVYVSSVAAEQLKAIAAQNSKKPQKSHIYAVHIYNYAKGPRLVVIGASPLSKQ
ncbi:hypothetical protein [Neptunomonas japonica]|uniref:hypothetical protein n=1 Tax=Neptunomonas japonica TaxID=417574 RepID=UPI0004235A2A|nr:hypothetical protein [Neptunomonas japonica]